MVLVSVLQRSFLFSLFTLLISCNQNELIGEWRPVRNRFDNVMQWQQPLEINFDKPDSVKAILLRERLTQEQSGAADTNAILNEIDSLVRLYLNARLTLNKDHSFTIINNGFLFPNVIPGWHIRDTLVGKWSERNDSLKLDIGEKETHFSVQYRIVKNNDDSLILRELLYATEAQPSRELTFVRE
ncbi:MAG TPA: hypothetical protein VGD22_08205 [Sphingobacteriaceae bacterium]